MISPYAIHVSDERLAAIKSKIEAYDWGQLPDTGEWKSGVGIADLKRLVTYWRENFDWRVVEKRLNLLPNFMAEIDGEHIHFVHMKGKSSRPPLLLLHGWPGSYLEFQRMLEPLVSDGHDVVVPSLPGFAFSHPISGIIGPRRAAQLMHGLMTRLFGQTRYIIQGGDWGHGIAGWAAHDRPETLLGIHINMVNLEAEGIIATTPEEKDFIRRRSILTDRESGYNHQQETRPQTLGVALADSPVGTAGWILEKIGKWADLPTRADGDPDIWSKFSEEELLTNIMLYIAPSSIVTSTWIYQGKRDEGSAQFPLGTHIRVPTGIAAFPDPVFVPPPRSYAQKTYNVVHWTDMPRGGHFAAWEEPALLLADMRAFITQIAAKHS